MSKEVDTQLRKENAILNQHNAVLRAEKELLQKEKAQLTRDNDILVQHNTILKAEKELLEKEKKQMLKDLEDCRWNLDFAIRREQLFEQEASYEYCEGSPNILSGEELLKQLINEHYSVCRFGDGELELMLGEARPWFQSPNPKLSQRLREVFNSNENNILIAVSDNFGDLRKYTSEAAYYIRDYLKDGKRQKLLELLDQNRTYYDAYVSRPYLMYRDKSYATVIFKKFKELWKNRKVLLVEGEYIRSGINNDLFDGVKELRRIICPSQNAFDLYDEILSAILENADGDLVLLALGPTATVLAYDLALQGIQAIDIGQIDNEYEWFLAGEENRAEIKGKAVPEREDLHEAEACDDPVYLKQVIRRIGVYFMKPDISVIVPVYNVENYLSCCINSLLTQSYENIEIICVNDGSTDSSLEILKEFQRKDKRIVIISKENAGYGDTINRGLQEARGTYVGIVESDDFAEPDMYEKLYKCAGQYHADIVKANFNDYFTASGEKRFHEYLVCQQYDTLIEQDKSLILLGPVIWAGLYRKSFLQDNNIWLLDTAGASYQDTSFSFKAFLCAQKVVFLKDAVINYRNDRDDSSVNSNEKIFCICNEVEECKRFMTQRMADQSMMPLFVRNKFYRYKWNLDRLHGANKIKFFEYMHHDFLNDEIQGYFERKYWNMEDWVFAHRLIYDFQNLFEDLKKSNTSELLMFDRDKVTELSILQSIEGVYIYGAGKRADKIYDYLCKNNINVMAYVISDGQLLKKSDKKIPTLYISDIKYPMNELFIIGVSERYEDEIINELSKRHINNYININHLLKE